MTALVAAAGAQPTAAAVAYDVGRACHDSRAGPRAGPAHRARGRRRRTPTSSAPPPAGSRATPASWLADAAVRASQWSGAADTFPGAGGASRLIDRPVDRRSTAGHSQPSTTRSRSARLRRPRRGRPRCARAGRRGSRCAARSTARMPTALAPWMSSNGRSPDEDDPPGSSTPTAAIAAANASRVRLGPRRSRWCRPRRRSGRARRPGRSTSSWCCAAPHRVATARRSRSPRSRSAVSSGAASGSVQRVRLPGLLVGRERRRVPLGRRVDAGCTEHVVELCRLVPVARPPPRARPRPACSRSAIAAAAPSQP